MSSGDAIAPRVRSVENMVSRAQEVTGKQSTQGACLTCHVTLWVSFFFDGTGNHKDMHFPKKHSNVAALVDAHEDDRPSGKAAFYYEGIGMPFEFKDRLEKKVVVAGRATRIVEEHGHKEDESGWNKAFGSEMDKRLEKAMFDFQTFVEEWRRRRRVDQINLAAFGFSRGSTTARAFMHWLVNHSKVQRNGSQLSYEGIPLIVKFLGVFDTVESVGSAGDNDEPELIKTSVPPFVERCCHIVAAHELRHAFPITVLGVAKYTQVVYPGAHADVGGGYADGEQGRTNALARVGLLQMLDEARGAGLKMRSIGEMQASNLWRRLYQPSFDVAPETKAALSSYMRNVNKPAGPMQEVFASHCALYQAWIDAGLAIEDAQSRTNQARGKPAQRERLDEALVEQHLLTNLARTPRGRGATVGGGPVRDTVPPSVEDFFQRYVHDSFQHFSLSGGTMQYDLTTADYYKLRTIKSPKS